MLVSCINLHSELHFFKSFSSWNVCAVFDRLVQKPALNMLICWCCVQLRITASIGVHDSATPQTCIAIVHFLLICDEVCLKKNAIFPRVQSICLRVFQVSNSSNWAQLSLVLRQQIQFDDVGHRSGRPFDSITRGINQGLKASRPQGLN